MKVSTEELDQRQLLVNIEVEDERVEKAMDQAYRRLVGKLNVPGFRKGKAPRPLVERMVGREALLEDAIESLVPTVYKEAIDAHGIKAAAQPRLEVVSVAPLQVKATVPLEPRVELGDYRSVRVTPDSTEVKDEEVAQVIEEVRASHAQWVPVERPVQQGDRVAMDVRATVGERTVMDSKDAEFVVEHTGPQPAPGFSHEILGTSAEETRQFSLVLPDDLSDKEIAGQRAGFEVRVHWVKERQLPPLDDAFVSGLGQFEHGQFERVDELREHVLVDLRGQKEEASRRKTEENAVRAAVERSTVELPPQLVEGEADHIRERFASSLDSRGITIEQYLRFANKEEAEFRAELRAEAEATLKRSFVLDALADAEGIEVADSEVDEEIRRMGQDSPDSQRLIKNALARQETRERVRSVLRERKAVRRLVDIATGAQELTSASQGARE